MRHLPVFLALGAIAVLSIMDALIKAVSASYPTVEIAFLRFACGTIVSAIVFAVVRPGLPSRETAVANATRGLLVVVTAVSFFYGLATLPLAEAITLSFLAPVFVAVFGALLLKEKITRQIVTALAAGFAGMVVIVAGQFEDGFGFRGPTLGIAAVLVSAMTYAMSTVVLRARALRDPPITIVLFQNMGPALILAPFAWWFWVPPSPADLGMMLVIGVLGTTGHLLFAHAFARAPASRLAPLEYTALLWASGLGYAVFGEVPTLWTLGGATLIVLGAIAAARK